MKTQPFGILVIALSLLLSAAACAPQATPAPTSTLPPEPTAMSTVTPIPTPSPEICLQGDWLIGKESVEKLLVELTSIPSLTVLEGSLLLKFEGNTFAYHSDDLFLRSSYLDGFLDAKANVLIEGTFTTEGEVLLFNKTGSQNELYEWRVVKGEYILPFTGTSPVIDFKITENGTYACSGDTLLITLTDASGAETVIDLKRVK